LLSRSFDSIKLFLTIKYTFTRYFRIELSCRIWENNIADYYYRILSVHLLVISIKTIAIVLVCIFCLHYSVRNVSVSHEMAFCGEFLRNSSWEAGVLEVSPVGGWWWKG
jgi:hypothetical protein